MKKYGRINILSLLLIALILTITACGTATSADSKAYTYDTTAYSVREVLVPASWGKVVDTSIDQGYGAYTFTFEDGHVLHMNIGSIRSVIFEFVAIER